MIVYRFDVFPNGAGIKRLGNIGRNSYMVLVPTLTSTRYFNSKRFYVFKVFLGLDYEEWIEFYKIGFMSEGGIGAHPGKDKRANELVSKLTERETLKFEFHPCPWQ